MSAMAYLMHALLVFEISQNKCHFSCASCSKMSATFLTKHVIVSAILGGYRVSIFARS